MGVAVYAEDDLLPISALQHLLFCERQCALIHVERLWAENRYTVEGRHLHEKADSGKRERRGGLKTARGLMLRSLALGLYGKADVVEFHGGVPFPVEYKRGRPKRNGADLVQLCAQALCLEETLGVAVPAGAMFYGQTRRRVEVAFDDTLRSLTLRTIERLHALIDSGQTPPAEKEKKCERCSLIHLCLPEARLGSAAASRYLDRVIAQATTTAGPVSE